MGLVDLNNQAQLVHARTGAYGVGTDRTPKMHWNLEHQFNI